MSTRLISTDKASFSREALLTYLKTRDPIHQKRMLFMLETLFLLKNNPEYYTDFTHTSIPNSGKEGRLIATPFIKAFGNYIGINKDFAGFEMAWEQDRDIILSELGLEDVLVSADFEKFKFGLFLKQRRKSTKSIFCSKTGLGDYFVTKVEDHGFLCQKEDFSKYIHQGLKERIKVPKFSNS